MFKTSNLILLLRINLQFAFKKLLREFFRISKEKFEKRASVEVYFLENQERDQESRAYQIRGSGFWG
jgi:hypothetical protein